MVFAWEADSEEKIVNFFGAVMRPQKNWKKWKKKKCGFPLFLFNNIAVLGIG